MRKGLQILLLGLVAAGVTAKTTVVDLEMSKKVKDALSNLSPDQGKLVEQFVLSRDRCTTIAVGPEATVDGSAMNTYNADCADCDWRVNKVPAKDWAPGSLRPVYQSYSPYPARVRNDRGETWRVDNLEDLPQREVWKTYPPSQTILGYIPQVNHTYALFEGMYSIMNEHQVGMGESTCAAKLWAAPLGYVGIKNGTAMLEINELSQIALERSRTAREAIQTMGDLAMKYGYYSATWDVSFLPEILQLPYAEGEGGEALTVIDPYEAWMFHILPDDTGRAAIWVAQRVPDDHITVCANSFVIREVDPNNDDFMYSPNLWSVAERMGWWDESMGKLDFLKTYAPQRYHPNYSTKRVWRVFDLAAPGLKLPFNTDAWGDAYPFSVKVESKISHLDLFNYSRDYYAGTPFDTNAGRAGGPYGDPSRWDPGAWGNMTVWDTLQGEFPRTINLFRTSYSTVNQARRNVPDILALSWIAMYATDQSVYTPVYVGTRELPVAYTTGTMLKYNSTSAFWNTCVVGNYVSRFYNFAIAAVRQLQRYYESQSQTDNSALEKKILSVLQKHGVKTRLEEDQAQGTVESTLDSTSSEYSEHMNWPESDDDEITSAAPTEAPAESDSSGSSDAEEGPEPTSSPLIAPAPVENDDGTSESDDSTANITDSRRLEASSKHAKFSKDAESKAVPSSQDNKKQSSDENKKDSGSKGGESIQDLVKRAEGKDGEKKGSEKDDSRSDPGKKSPSSSKTTPTSSPSADSKKQSSDENKKDSGSKGGESIQDLIKRAEGKDGEKKGSEKDDSRSDPGKKTSPDRTDYGSNDKSTKDKKNAQDSQYHHHNEDKSSHHDKDHESEGKKTDSNKDGNSGKDSKTSQKPDSPSKNSPSDGGHGEPAFVKKLIDEIRHKYDPKKEPWQDQVIEDLTNHTVTYGRLISQSYRDLLPELFTTYRDGFVMNSSSVTIEFTHMFYPMWWLKFVGYFDYKPNHDGIYFSSNPYGDSKVLTDEMSTMGLSAGSVASVLSLAVLGYAGFVMGKRYEEKVSANNN